MVDDGRLSAVVFGDRALVTVEPAVSGSGGSAYRVASIPLDPASFRSAPVTARPAMAAHPTRRSGAGTGSGYREQGGADSWRLTCWRASRR